MRAWPCLLLTTLVLGGCGTDKDTRVRELEELVAQLESENARLRKQIPPEDPGAPRQHDVEIEPGWEIHTVREPAVEEPPPVDLSVISQIVEEPKPVESPATEPATPEPAESAPAAVAADPPAAGAALLVIHSAVAARNVANRVPIDTAASFPASVGKVYCFTDVSPTDAAPSTTSLIHRWYLDDQSQGETRLKVAGNHWRTYSNRTVSEAKKGAWRVDLLDSAGHVLHVVRFTVE